MGQTRHALPNDDAASDCAHDLVGLMRAALPSARVEHIVLSGFDSRGRLLFLDSIGRGSRGAVPVDGAALFALLATPGLTAIVLAHNHPSGDPTPSLGDIALTARIAQIARFARIALTDHLIFGHERHASFRALSLL
ncbi:JAB domain-containing protein [Flavisphingopyxis soli]|nr:JAB domain-containing protein [Sphingorhabdus soli]